MRIIVDENIPMAKEIFSEFGQVIPLPGRKIDSSVVRDADILLVRSVTPVNATLLNSSNVRFVGSATIGRDHVDTNYLSQKGISFSDAAGSNANSVAEYVITALLVLADLFRWNLSQMSIGIVGIGNIGSRVERMARLLGMDVWPNDPPLQRKTGEERFFSLEESLDADIVTFHVPLTREGLDPTFHLLDAAKLENLRPNTVIFNTSRGSVIDNQALKSWLKKSGIGPVALDVWENEPDIDIELLEQTTIGTPHIAGYSMDGKFNGTICLYKALSEFLGHKATIDAAEYLPEPKPKQIEINAENKNPQQVLKEIFTSIYDIMADDQNLRQIKQYETNKRPIFFDQLRHEYPVRRESYNYSIRLQNGPKQLTKYLSSWGFANITNY